MTVDPTREAAGTALADDPEFACDVQGWTGTVVELDQVQHFTKAHTRIRDQPQWHVAQAGVREQLAGGSRLLRQSMCLQ